MRFNRRLATATLIAGIVLGLALLVWPGTRAAAQDGTEELWNTPINLSRSGAASDPVAVVDATGRIHVVWRDAFDGAVYTSGDGADWTAPVPAELPFNTRYYYPTLRAEQPTPQFTPRLIADSAGRIHAFWKDDEESLYASSVPADRFAEFAAWTERALLSQSALDYGVTVGPDGRLHLVYLRTAHSELAPAGVYYRQLGSGELFWPQPVALYQSIYFRLLAPGDLYLAVAAGENSGVYVAWNDPRLGAILQVESANGGLAWGEAREVVDLEPEAEQPVGPEETAEAGRAGLAELVTTTAGTVHLLWQASDGETCELVHQVSTDYGASWDAPQAISVDLCVPVKQVFQDGEGRFSIQLEIEGGDALLAWDGGTWSEPLVLPAGFEDLETGRAVELGCEQVATWGEGRLFLVGCDQAGGGEIWLVTQLQDVQATELFVNPTPAPTSAWSTPVCVSPAHVETPVDLRNPAVAGVPFVEGRFHLVWSQPAEDDPDGPGRALVYARWDVLDPQRYPRPVTLLTPADEKAEQPAMAVDAMGRLHLVWSGGQSGEIMYSRAMADSAFNPTNWAEVQPLPMLQPIGSSPAVAIGRDGAIHVVFAVPINDGRGIYYTNSLDGGETWSEAVMAADGAGAGWAYVDHPVVAAAGDGTIHVAWSVLPPPGSVSESAVYYARSGDQGESWSEPYEAASGAVDWPRLATAGALQVHLVWAEMGWRMVYQHRWSADGGQTWSRMNPIPEMRALDGPVGLVVDEAGRVHAVGVTDGGGYFSTTVPEGVRVQFTLQHWVWEGERWVPVEVGRAADPADLIPDSLAAAVGTGYRLGVVLAGSLLKGDNDEEEWIGAAELVSRPVELPAVLPTPLPTLTPTPTSLPQPTPTATSLPTPTLDFSMGQADQLQVGPVSLPGSWAGLVVGAVPAVMIVLVAFGIGVLLVRGRR